MVKSLMRIVATLFCGFVSYLMLLHELELDPNSTSDQWALLLFSVILGTWLATIFLDWFTPVETKTDKKDGGK